MTTAYDYSSGPIDPAALKAAKVTTVMRYVSTPGNPKNITRSEYQALTAAGIEVGLVYETTADWMLGGYAAGLIAGASARAQATAVGYPTSRRIWYADDFADGPAQIPVVLDTLHGCSDAEGSKNAVGLYADYDAVEASVTAGYGGPWQTVAWSNGRRSQHAVLYQTGQIVYCGGVQVDINELSGPLFPTAAPPPAPTKTMEDDDMQQIEPISAHPGLYNFPTINKGHFRLTVGDGGTADVRAVAWDANGNALVLCGDKNDGAVKKGARDFAIAASTVAFVTVQRKDSGSFPIGVTAY